MQHMSAGVEPMAEEVLLGGRETRALAAEDAVQRRHCIGRSR